MASGVHSKGNGVGMLAFLKKNILGIREVPEGPVERWARARELAYARLPEGGETLGGELLGRNFRMECVPSHRPYIDQFAWVGRFDLNIGPEVEVVLINRELKRRFESEIDAYRAGHLRLPDGQRQVPEEWLWVDEFPDQGWSGPDDAFWERYAVLTDVREVVGRWVDEAAVAKLMAWPSSVAPERPLMIMLLRGKLYARMQVSPTDDPDVVLHLLDLMEHLGERALRLMDRPKRSRL